MKDYTATYRFEVYVAKDLFAPSLAEWVAYDSELVGEEDETTGEHCAEEVWNQTPVELAQDRLDDALADLGSCRGGLPSRIVLWTDDGSPENPTVVIQATEDQMAIGRLRAASYGVASAVRELSAARRRLRNQILAADGHVGLGRNVIAREVEHGGWSRRLVLQFLAGHDIIRSAQRALPRDWPKDRLGFDELYRYYDEDDVSEHLGPYWCGPVCMGLNAGGQVSLWMDYDDYTVVDDYDPFDTDDDEDQPSEPTEQEKQEAADAAIRDAAQRAEDADLVVSRLQLAGLELRSPTGAEAKAPELLNAQTTNTALTLVRRK